MEPLAIGPESRHRGPLMDRALELVSRSSGLHAGLPAGVHEPLAALICAMNCYYSNLIEGHNTHPIDIERALNNDYNSDPHKRDLQLEARAHVAVQKWIDGGAIDGRETATESLREIHRRFSAELPDDLLWATDSSRDQKVKVVPGEFRTGDVVVGRHIPVSPAAVPRFMQRFEEFYGRLGRSETIIAAAAAHHRLLWVHPFLDGNGRVARLMTHGVLRNVTGSGGLWSVARGLARREPEYKQHLMACDSLRRNDIDGRGHLSEEALASFTAFFLDTCIDQVKFMESLMEPRRLRARIMLWAEEEIRVDALPALSVRVLDALLNKGELQRSELPAILDTGERNARRTTSALFELGVIRSSTPRSPIHLAFPATLADRWMPGLFPQR